MSLPDTLWLQLLSRGDQWSRYTFLFSTRTPFGPLDWSERECGRTVRRMTDAGLLERRYIVAAPATRYLAASKHGHVRAEYRVPAAVRALLRDRLVTRPPRAPHGAPPPQAPAAAPSPPEQLAPDTWAAYIAERYGEAAARSLHLPEYP